MLFVQEGANAASLCCSRDKSRVTFGCPNTDYSALGNYPFQGFVREEGAA